jgi:hypothetical protein
MQGLLVLTIALGACNGWVGDPGASKSGGPRGPGDPPVEEMPVACDLGVPQAGVAPLRRLSPVQYANTVRDLVGDTSAEPIVDDEAMVVTERGVRQFRDAAELVLARRESWSREVFPCATDGAPDDACASRFIDSFAARAFRRPITEDERGWLEGVYRDALAEGMTFDEAMGIAFEVILQSPQFIYLNETGVEGATGSTRPLTQFELASRLSYFLWNTMPDEALFTAAQDGVLDETGLRAQAERMLEDPRTQQTVQRFFWHWLQLNGGRLHNSLEETAKDGELFPEYDRELQAAMRTEFEALVRDTFESGGSFEDLLTSRRAYVNGPLADLYGVSGPSSADDWQWVDLDPSERAGILTRGVFLTVFSSATVQSPIRRGVFVVEHMFCNELGEPPPNASDVPVVGGEVENEDGETELRSVRQDVAVRTTSDATCSTCHNIINPAGFAFEHYDAIGRYRSTELTSDLPIDSSGEVRGTDVDGPVADAVALSERIASSAQAQSCFSGRWFEQALGRAPSALDRCSVEAVETRFRESGDIRELLLAIVESVSFQHVNVPAE